MELLTVRPAMVELLTALTELQAPGMTRLQTLRASAAIGLRQLDDELTRLCLAADAVRQAAMAVRI